MDDKKVNAIIGIVKCPHTGHLYAVRVEIQGKKWIATWSFPIKDEVAKREGYTANQFPPDIMYSKAYRGCPYCKKFEDLALITRLKVQKIPRINVSSPMYDNIGQILSSLKIPYSNFNTHKFQCDLLFLNCGTTDSVNRRELHDFVNNGGCVYASDLTDSIITEAFPGLLKIRDHNGEVCKLTADVCDVELHNIIGQNIQVEFDLPYWAVLESSSGTTLLSVAGSGKYAGLPIMVRLKYGKGTIFYTCFHNYAQASEKEKALLQLLVLKQIGSNVNVSIEQASLALGVDIEKIKSKFRSNW